MKSLILLVVLISLSGLVLLGCGEVNSQGQEAIGGEAEVGQEVGQADVKPVQADCSGYPFGDKVCNLIAAGKIVHCVFNNDKGENEMWLKAGNPNTPNTEIKMRAKIFSDKGLMNQITYLDKGSMKLLGYTWKDGASVGIKMETALSGSTAGTGGVKTYETGAVEISCEEADVGADFLNPPSSVNFMSVQELTRNPALAQQIMG